MKIIKEGLGITKSVWSMTFKMVRKYPSILFPFFIIAISQAVALAILFYFPQPPLSAIFAPPIKAFFGEHFLHYPANFLLLPRLFYYGNVLVMVIIGAIMFGMAVGLIHQANEKGGNLRLMGSLNKSIRRYLILVGIWLIIFILTFIVLRIPIFLIIKFLPKIALTNIFLQVIFYGNFILAFLTETFFIYVYPAAIIETKGFLSALKKGLGLSKKLFLPTFILIAIPRLLEVLVIVLGRYLLPHSIRVLPELTLVILGLGIAASFIANFLVMSSTVNLFILTKETGV